MNPARPHPTLDAWMPISAGQCHTTFCTYSNKWCGSKKTIICTKLACLKSRVQIVGKKIRRDATQLQRSSELNYFQRCFWQQIQNEHIYFNRFAPSSVRISFEITFFPQSVWKQRAIWFFFPFLSDCYMFLSNQVKTLLHLLESVTLLGALLHFIGIFRLLLALPEEQKLQFIEKDIDR